MRGFTEKVLCEYTHLKEESKGALPGLSLGSKLSAKVLHFNGRRAGELLRREGRVRIGEVREIMGWAEKGFVVGFIRTFTFILRETRKNHWKFLAKEQHDLL